MTNSESAFEIVYDKLVKALENNDRLKSDFEIMKNLAEQNLNDFTGELIKNKTLLEENDKLKAEIEQLKLYATNLINARNLSEETATSIRAKMQRELMMQKEIEQLKSELEQIHKTINMISN